MGDETLAEIKQTGGRMSALSDVEGIGDKYSAQLEAAGVDSLESLLEQSASPKGRKALSEKSGISDTLILKWANRADLFRIKGIGSEYSDLLEAAGVDTVPELARRNASNLHEAMTQTNEEKQLVRRMPSADQVAGWISEAKTLPRVLNY